MRVYPCLAGMLDKNRTFDDIEKNQMDQENQCSPLITSRDRRREYYNMKEAGRKVWQSQKLFDFPVLESSITMISRRQCLYPEKSWSYWLFKINFNISTRE